MGLVLISGPIVTPLRGPTRTSAAHTTPHALQQRLSSGSIESASPFSPSAHGRSPHWHAGPPCRTRLAPPFIPGSVHWTHASPNLKRSLWAVTTLGLLRFFRQPPRMLTDALTTMGRIFRSFHFSSLMWASLELRRAPRGRYNHLPCFSGLASRAQLVALGLYKVGASFIRVCPRTTSLKPSPARVEEPRKRERGWEPPRLFLPG